MTKNEFIKEVLEFCELEKEDANLETQLIEVEGYDSMAVMTMIAFIDENFSVQLSAEQFQSITDFQSLINLIGEDKFN